MRWALTSIALLSGMGLALQVGLNNSLRARIGHPIQAALVSFGVGTMVLLLYLVAARPAPPDAARFAGAPWWIWMGGVVGAGYVAASAQFAPRLGAAPWLALVVTGQILASVAIDHFGLVGFRAHAVSMPRIVGVGLLLAGVVVVVRS